MDLNWTWYTLCICLYTADLGWALLIFWGWLAICWSRMASPGTAGLSFMWSFITEQVVSKERAEVGQGLLACSLGGHIPPYHSGKSPSHGQPTIKGGEIGLTPCWVGPPHCRGYKEKWQIGSCTGVCREERRVLAPRCLCFEGHSWEVTGSMKKKEKKEFRMERSAVEVPPCHLLPSEKEVI